MRLLPLAVVVALAMGGAACAARAQVAPPEPELPVLDPPPAPPRIVAIYVEPEDVTPVEAPIAAEPATPSLPQPKPAAPAPPPGPLVTEEPPQPPPATPPALTLTPAPGTEAKTEASIRALLGQVTKNLTRVNATTLSADGRTQYEAARRFVQQSEDALKVRNLLYAGKLADKAAAMAAVLVR
jgi:hypothetical protein